MVVYSSARARSAAPTIAALPDIARVDGMKILGVYVNNNLHVNEHIDNVCQTAAQCLYAIKLLKAHGLPELSIHDVCKATLVSYLTYAIPAWWGFTSVAEQQQLQAVLNRAIKWGFYKDTSPTIEQICVKRDSKLFISILSNRHHVLHQYLPPVKTQKYNMCLRAHNREQPNKKFPLLSKNFLYRQLYKT